MKKQEVGLNKMHRQEVGTTIDFNRFKSTFKDINPVLERFYKKKKKSHLN